MKRRSTFSRASIFIFPGKGTVTVESPLAVIESLAHGLYLVTTGDNSTRELVRLGMGQLVKNFAELDIEECLDRSSRLSQKFPYWHKKHSRSKTNQYFKGYFDKLMSTHSSYH